MLIGDARVSKADGSQPRPEQHGAVPHIDSGILPRCALSVRRQGILRCPGRGPSAYAGNEESPSPGEAARAGVAGPGPFAHRPAALVIGTASVTTVLPEIPPETLTEWQRVVDPDGTARPGTGEPDHAHRASEAHGPGDEPHRG